MPLRHLFRRSGRLYRVTVLSLTVLATASAVGVPHSAAATVLARYDPPRTLVLLAGTHIGYRLDSDGRRLSSTSMAVSGVSNVAVSRRATFPLLTGRWFLVTTGALKHRWVRESPSAYLPGIAEQRTFSPHRVASLMAGTHKGYRYDSLGRITAQAKVSLTTTASYAVSRQAVINGRWQLYLASGPLTGHWVWLSAAAKLLPIPTVTPAPTPAPTPTPTAAPTPTSTPSAAPTPRPTPTPTPTASPVVTPGPTVTATSATPDIALGAYVDQAPWNVAALDEFSLNLGGTPAIVMWYQDWADPVGKPFNTALVDAVRARGAMPMITWEPWDYRSGSDQPAFSLRSIADGAHDAHIRSWAGAVAKWGHPLYLRFAHEMNARHYPWSVGVNGNTSADYVAAWRHVRAVFAAEGASNVRWVWAPHIAYAGTTPFREIYPGDADVDWVGLDGYNGGTALPWGGWLSFATLFGPSYAELTALSSRPVLITEVASAEAGGSKAAWIEEAFLHAIPDQFPRVRGVIWFHANKETDWRLDSSAAARDAYLRVRADARYGARLP